MTAVGLRPCGFVYPAVCWNLNLPRVPAHFHRQSRNVFAVCLRFYPSLDPAQVLARKTCLFSIRFVLNGHLFNLIIVRLLNPIDI